MRSPIDVWAGIECSLNRVADRYFDQLARSGHYDRYADIDRLAALGIRAMRFPVLWERHERLGDLAWEWADRALERVRVHGIEPILGLVHHGSGPPRTSIVDPAFPERLAEYARRVAERYPWARWFTPINEPLTTARFATLYGYWYPHLRDPRAFSAAMIGQCTAIAAAMRAMREVIPDAALVQTEDLGKTHATERLQYQAEFENERRWLTFDLLCGRIAGDHPLAHYLRWTGVSDGDLERLASAPCTPAILGLNHYLTSERFLDERLSSYPAESHGGNGRDRYADIEAVRALGEGPAGSYALMHEAWDRYKLPMAVTEVHLGCTREQQMRWLDEVWHAAVRLRCEGADVRAVTAWSALGSFDWTCLLTREQGTYEPGLFDVRSAPPRPTALAAMVRSLATEGTFDHPVLHAPGWWRRDSRLAYPAASSPTTSAPSLRLASRNGKVRPLVVLGATGTLGRAVARACDDRGLPYRLLARRELDIANARSASVALASYAPWAVVNCAGYVRVDDAEADRAACWRENSDGAAIVAAECARRGIQLVTLSSDLVFGGAKATPYVESDPVEPLNEYGRSKADAEQRVLAACPQALVVRTSAFFGDRDEHNFVTKGLQLLTSGSDWLAADDLVVSPTYVPELADSMLDLLIDGERGLWHLANAGAVTWLELARRAADAAGLDGSRIIGVPARTLAPVAARPRFSALASERGPLLGPLDAALARYVATRPWERTEQTNARPSAVRELASVTTGAT